MNVLVIYCHPNENSFTAQVKESFLRGLVAGGNTYELSDLYAMNFNCVISPDEYRREAYYDAMQPVADDVYDEQRKLDRADAIAFIYPVFWTEAPAMLTGWFQRVWTYGYAYGDDRTMKQLKKAVFFITMGGSMNDAVRLEQIEAMRTVMVGDRINDRAKKSEVHIFDEMTHDYANEENRKQRVTRFTEQAYDEGYYFD